MHVLLGHKRGGNLTKCSTVQDFEGEVILMLHLRLDYTSGYTHSVELYKSYKFFKISSLILPLGVDENIRILDLLLLPFGLQLRYFRDQNHSG